MIGIYKITNLINGKCYIGQSRDINKRLNAHKTSAFDVLNHSYNNHFYKSIRKYGLENFSFEIIEECSIDQLNEREIYWIDKFNSFFNGYNLTFGGDNSGTEINKQKIIQIIADLEQTNLIQKEIANKNDISEEMVQGINTGRYWHHNRVYPIRPQKEKQFFYCVDCGKEISKGSMRCRECEDKHRIIPLDKMPVSRDELKQLIRTKSFLEIGRIYKVSDNCIRKWCDKFNLPRKKTEIKKYTNAEWQEV